MQSSQSSNESASAGLEAEAGHEQNYNEEREKYITNGDQPQGPEDPGAGAQKSSATEAWRKAPPFPIATSLKKLTSVPPPVIKCIGPPPERHADRIVAEWMRGLALAKAQLTQCIAETIARSSDGSPKAQARMAARVRKAGALDVFLEPGKRGKYTLGIFHLNGWDRSRDVEIAPDDPIPDKPWLVYSLIFIEGLGKRRIDTHGRYLVFVTHHVLSRAAQRRGVRTVTDMTNMAAGISLAVMTLLEEKGGFEAAMAAPPEGWRTGLKDGGTVVLQRAEEHDALVAVTLF
jgi:hypothetical protein